MSIFNQRDIVKATELIDIATESVGLLWKIDVSDSKCPIPLKKRLVSSISNLRDARKYKQKRQKTEDTKAISDCGIRKLRRYHNSRSGTEPLALPTTAPDSNIKLNKSSKCYICKKKYILLHHFYDQLCCDCGDLNYEKRNQPLIFTGTSIVTGGRVKIGYAIALKLLRAGSKVIITTRFPNDAASRYSTETDYQEWKHRLEIYGIDFRDIRSVELFCIHLAKTLSRLDILINNAAQTIARPPEFYSHLVEGESKMNKYDTVRSCLPVARISNETTSSGTTPSGTVSNETDFPPGQYDCNHQQIDNRTHNSWVSTLEEVSTTEMLEVLAINSAAPFVLISRLKKLMGGSENSFIINVSSMEGSFVRQHKTNMHPHTNGAKAYLDMITKTSSSEFSSSNIFMNSVDTGWVTNENPRPHLSSFVTPIDELDGAMRVLDPICVALAGGICHYGSFFKDYRPIPF
jgi:NAD(P)-dependent dehydrogenase (short-subunit alcohol dehydrogenase family)